MNFTSVLEQCHELYICTGAVPSTLHLYWSSAINFTSVLKQFSSRSQRSQGFNKFLHLLCPERQRVANEG